MGPERLDCRGRNGRHTKHDVTDSRRRRMFIKRLTNKLLRRRARLDPENAPGRVRDVTRGWSS